MLLLTANTSFTWFLIGLIFSVLMLLLAASSALLAIKTPSKRNQYFLFASVSSALALYFIYLAYTTYRML
ncbi:hypothetical protein SAMN05421780_108151 [Flexibacter flexilis DSM 6793]|uniref:Uncharacterized protein n=1 Tax=Flexibacter flexilis DSM 6793 TaxID=927664 RepID=A0A1I1LB75_9BACT|nr:hypothetical protein [Flexibacter flexilis]SFC70344.1 hypothetical protein SAMN05421780_108151 [Flexibacter flexilis DSM 6793]